MNDAKRDSNYVPTLLAVNNSDNDATVVLWADPTTHRLLVDVSGGSGTSSVDDSAFVAGTGSGTPAMGFFSTDTVDAGDVGVLAMDANRRLFVSIEADNVGIGGGTQYAEDTAHGSGDTGTFALVVRKDTPANLSSTDGDYEGLQVSAGRLWGSSIITDVVPGTGATKLGKAIDSVVGATDTGIALLAKHTADSVHLTTADGDYDVLRVDARGALVSNVEQHHVFDSLNATTGWTVLGNDTTNLATTKKHVTGTDALTFDKVNGAANTVFAGIEKTLSSVDLGEVSQHDILQGTFYLPTITDVSYVFIRIGTDSTNYNEWRLEDTALTAATFEVGAATLGDANYAGITGNGWDTSAITYIAIGVAFDAETDTLAGIVFDEISYHTNQHTNAIIGSEVSSSVSSVNVNLQKVGESVTDKGAGNVSNGSQRVVLASDQNFVHLEDTASGAADAGIPAMARRTATPADTSGTDLDYEMLQMDNGRLWTSATIDAALPAGTNAIGKLAANSGVDIGDVDVTSITGVIMSNDGMQITGDEAHDAVDAGNPVKIGAKAVAFDSTAPGTNVAENDRTDLKSTLEGRLLVETTHPNFWDVSADYASAQTNVTVKAAPGASLKLYITDVIVSNGATAGNITLLDGSAGTVLLELYPAINGGLTHSFRSPIALTANTLLAITSTTVTTHSVTISGFIAA